MKNKIIFIGIIFVLMIITNLIMQVFIWPRLVDMPFFAKYQLESSNKKPIIINKTEKITVKENFSLSKTAEKVIPAVVRIYFLPKDKTVNKKIELDLQESTGVILSGDGTIVTVLPNFNLEDKTIKVFLRDNREFIATIKRKDVFNNLLILKIEADNLPVAPFGESNNLHNGEKLILVGQSTSDDKPIFALRTIEEHNNNFNEKGTSFLFSDKNSDVFLLDDTLNKQFIGSVAVDFKGTIIGLVDIVQYDVNEKPLVIPLENIKKSINSEVVNDKQSNIFGVYYLNITKALKIFNNLPIDYGALIYTPSGKEGLAILNNSIGKKIGLKLYDIITEVNGIKIDNDNTLSSVIGEQNLNDGIRVKIIRDNKEMELTTE